MTADLALMDLKYQAVSDVGLRREHNEDMAVVEGRCLRDGHREGATAFGRDHVAAFAVADGMGGCSAGEVASEIVSRAFARFIASTDSCAMSDEVLRQWATSTNRLVYDTAQHNARFHDMGSTFVGAVFSVRAVDNRYGVWIVNVGDSRCYRLRAGSLTCLTADHSMRQLTGDPTVPSNLIYNFMGIVPENFSVDIHFEQVMSGDVFMLCSDGLSDVVTGHIMSATRCDAASLLKETLRAGAPDNISIITISTE